MIRLSLGCAHLEHSAADVELAVQEVRHVSQAMGLVCADCWDRERRRPDFAAHWAQSGTWPAKVHRVDVIPDPPPTLSG